MCLFFLPFQLLMPVIISRDFCLLFVSQLQLMLEQVQELRCLATDIW